MVVRIQLTIKHIRGHSFTIETDAESEVLGLKVQIWESQKIAIENQRLVFSGKELADNVTLSQMNIGDNSTIFLVESASDIPQQQSETPQVTIEAPIQIVSTADPNICQQQCAGIVPVPINYFEPMEVETALSEERMQSVIDLAFWARLYCILGIIWSIFICLGNLYALLLVAMFICGYIGTRRINRCLLVFPLLLAAVFGFGLTITFMYEMFANSFNVLELLCFFIGVIHLFIFSCFCKLMTRIGKLSCQEWHQTCVRIQSKCCW